MLNTVQTGNVSKYEFLPEKDLLEKAAEIE